MNPYPLGSTVRFNSGVAPAFHGCTGTVIERKQDVFQRTIYVVELDIPTAPSASWPVLATLGAPIDCLERIA